MEFPNKGNYGANDFVPRREAIPVSQVISMGLKQVPLVERLSLSLRAPH